jgi:uncharacterized protein involved in exopolysaccharide biosynthesis
MRIPMIGTQALAREPHATDVRLELTTAEVRQVFALYGGSPRTAPIRAEKIGGGSSALDSKLLELRRLAWRWRRTLALTGAAAMALGAIFLLAVTPTFGVKALLVVEQRSESVRDGAAPHAPSGFLAGQAEILVGASLVQQALERSQPERAEREALAQALRAFSATPVVGTELIALEYHTQDPAGGVRFVQAVIDGYEELVRSLDAGGSGVAVRLLAAPAREAKPLWPRPAPVLLTCLVLGLLSGLGLAVLAERADRAEEPQLAWTEVREAAWAG